MIEYAYVYILANGYKKIYIGITTQLAVRVQQHKDRKDSKCHTARYNINRLVYFETFTTVPAAIAREKQLKGWLRIRKLQLIISTNPTWRDLSLEWGTPTEPFFQQTMVRDEREQTTTNTGVLRYAQDDDLNG